MNIQKKKNYLGLRLISIKSLHIHIKERLSRVSSCECNLINTTITEISQEEDLTDDCCGICVTYYIPNMTFFFCFTSESAPDIEYLNLCIL